MKSKSSVSRLQGVGVWVNVIPMTAYATLDLIGKHQIIADGMEEYVCEDTTHIDGIEGFWIYAKIWLYH